MSAAITVEHVTKAFGATVAVDDVSLEVAPATIHSFVGENGAGKSTLLGMLAGRLAPTSGTVRGFGEPIDGASPRSARAAGVVAIYQELTIIPTMTALANVFLADPRHRGTVLDRSRMRRRFAELARRVGADVPPDALARTLSVAQQQLLEVMRALESDARTIVLDEPTAPLPHEARERLLRLMEQLRSEGVTVIFVSHHLEEVLEVSDHVSVFRDGRLVASEPVGSWTKDDLIATMLGDVAAQRLRSELETSSPRTVSEDVALAVEHVDLPGVLHDVSLTVRRGEIVGVAGLVGSGRSSLLRVVAGLEPGASGSVAVHGRGGRVPRSVVAALRLGVALLPEDRKALGLVGTMSSTDNVVMSSLGHVSRLGWVRRRAARTVARDVGARFGVRPEYLDRDARHLSGGNQQKLLLARWALRRPRVLLADEPTRGIDIGAKQQIRDALRELADEGMSVVMVSAEHEELLQVADRIVVLARGRVAAELDNSRRDVDEELVLRAAFTRENTHVA